MSIPGIDMKFVGDRFLARSHKKENFLRLENFDENNKRKGLDIIFCLNGGSPSQWMVGLEYLHT